MPDQVAALLRNDLDIAELRGMLRLRQPELESQARTVTTRLAAVGARLQMIESENSVPEDYVIKNDAAVLRQPVTERRRHVS